MGAFFKGISFHQMSWPCAPKLEPSNLKLALHESHNGALENSWSNCRFENHAERFPKKNCFLGIFFWDFCGPKITVIKHCPAKQSPQTQLNYRRWNMGLVESKQLSNYQAITALKRKRQYLTMAWLHRCWKRLPHSPFMVRKKCTWLSSELRLVLIALTKKYACPRPKLANT